MRAITLALLCAAIAIPASAIADPITLQDTPCSSTGVCLAPAPTVDYLTMSDTYGRVTISINGEIYDSGVYAVSSPQEGFSGAVLYAADGTSVTVSAVTSVYYTRTVAGKGSGYRIKRITLVSGTVQ